MKRSTWKSLRELREIVAPAGAMYRDAHYLVADMRVDATAAARWVPRPLRVPPLARASLFTAWFPHSSFGSVYREAGLLLHVEHRGRPAVFSPWMLVDDDAALILGREVLGYPKKLGDVRFELAGDDVLGVAARRGTQLVHMEGTLGERVDKPPPMLGRPHRNVRGGPLSLPHVVAFTPREVAREVRRAHLTVTVGTSERDPLADLGFGPVEAAYLHRVDLLPSFPPVPVGIPSPSWWLRQLLFRAR